MSFTVVPNWGQLNEVWGAYADPEATPIALTYGQTSPVEWAAAPYSSEPDENFELTNSNTQLLVKRSMLANMRFQITEATANYDGMLMSLNIILDGHNSPGQSMPFLGNANTPTLLVPLPAGSIITSVLNNRTGESVEVSYWEVALKAMFLL